MKPSRGVIWFAALAGVLVILLHQSLFLGKGLVPADQVLTLPPWNQTIERSNPLLSDQAAVFLPAQEFAHQQSSFPMWDPNLCCGVPNLGNIQHAPLFPIRLLLSWLDPFSASGPAAFLKLLVAGCFTILYVRLLGVSHSSALLAGIVFSLSGFMIVWLGHPLVNCAMWLPALFFFIEKSSSQQPVDSLGAWAGFAIVFAFMILGGHPPTMIHVTIVATIYFLFRLKDHPLQRTALLASAAAVGLLLAAPQILPYLEYFRLSSSAQAAAKVERWSMHLQLSALIHFLLPNINGNPSRGFMDLQGLLGWRETQNFNERTGYVGILPLFFAFCAITLRRCKLTLFFALLAAGSILVICGVPPFPQLMRLLPILRFSNQMRLLLVVGFCVAVLAALGWDQFIQMRGQRQIRIVTAVFCLIVGAAFLCFWNVASGPIHNLDFSHWAYVKRQLLILTVGIVVTLALGMSPGNWHICIPPALCVTWTIADLLCFGSGYNPAVPRSRYYPPTPAIQWLQNDHSLFRIFGGKPMLSPNTTEVFGLSDARGCDFMTVQRYEELITGQSGDFFFYTEPQGFPAAFPLLNIKYILTQIPISLNPQIFEMVYSNEVIIYRFKACPDRAMPVFNYQVEPDPAALRTRVSSPNFDPRHLLLLENDPTSSIAQISETNATGSLQVISYQPDEVKINATFSHPGFLLLLDTYFPGWTATVNGNTVPIYRADYNFRAVPLPAGQSSVNFSYHPKSWRIGLWLCGLGIVILGAARFYPIAASTPRA